MAVSDDFLEFILDQYSDWGEVTSRRMFGGAGLYRNGKMFALIADNVLYLKVDDTNRDKFLAEDSKPFKPYANKATVMSYYEVPADVLEDSDALIVWSKESLSIQLKGKDVG